MKGIILLAVFASTFGALLLYVGFDTFDKRSSPGRVLSYFFIAVLAMGAAEWLLDAIGI